MGPPVLVSSARLCLPLKPVANLSSVFTNEPTSGLLLSVHLAHRFELVADAFIVRKKALFGQVASVLPGYLSRQW